MELQNGKCHASLVELDTEKQMSSNLAVSLSLCITLLPDDCHSNFPKQSTLDFDMLQKIYWRQIFYLFNLFIKALQQKY